MVYGLRCSRFFDVVGFLLPLACWLFKRLICSRFMCSWIFSGLLSPGFYFLMFVLLWASCFLVIPVHLLVDHPVTCSLLHVSFRRFSSFWFFVSPYKKMPVGDDRIMYITGFESIYSVLKIVEVLFERGYEGISARNHIQRCHHHIRRTWSLVFRNFFQVLLSMWRICKTFSNQYTLHLFPVTTVQPQVEK